MADWRQRFLEYYFSSLNPPQREAVFKTEGAVLVLSGAGSGKTTVIVNRIANMILFGNAYNLPAPPESEAAHEAISSYMNGENEDIRAVARLIGERQIRPWNILSITFTNKAAGEMKSRLEAALGEDAEEINASTFHSCCASILRREASALGFTSSFTIYDSDDTKRLITACMKELDIDTKLFPVRSVMSTISLAKNDLISSTGFENRDDGTMDAYRRYTIGSIYKYYQQRLREANALDFDDLLFETVRLFEQNPAILEKYQNRYRYILVDEYQDTNKAQYRIISLLAAKYGNLCVVGDDDQSIYKFRGATIENILSFEEQFGDCSVIKLEQNYRSTQVILDAANSIIKNNENRKPKILWTAAKGGDKIVWYTAADEAGEARFIRETIEEAVEKGARYSDFAVLYRMNALSNTIEQELFNKIPYKVYGGMRFYDRKEIRDIIAYLSILVNDWDSVRFRRIINEPKRGIGAATVTTLDNISRDLGIPYIEIMREAESYPVLGKKASTLKKFAAMTAELKAFLNEHELPEIVDEVLKLSGYKTAMEALGDEGEERLQNIYELKSSLAKYAEENEEEASLSGFLEEISLYMDVDTYEDPTDTVSLMTIHASKGLEFDTVFIAAMENGVFPAYKNLYEPAEMEEERRLAYVAVTRAKNRLYMMTTEHRRLFGKSESHDPSEFLTETDQSLIEAKTERIKTAAVMPKLPGGRGALSKPAFKKTIRADISALKEGVTVTHPKFGKGIIISALEMGDDKMLEISFEESGTKKIMAQYAKLQVN